MRLKDGSYTNSHGIGGLMLDTPTKNPKICRKLEFKVDDIVRCRAEESVYPFRGHVKKVLSNLAIIRIESTMKCDHSTAEHKYCLVVTRLADMEVIKSK